MWLRARSTPVVQVAEVDHLEEGGVRVVPAGRVRVVAELLPPAALIDDRPRSPKDVVAARREIVIAENVADRRAARAPAQWHEKRKGVEDRRVALLPQAGVWNFQVLLDLVEEIPEQRGRPRADVVAERTSRKRGAIAARSSP